MQKPLAFDELLEEVRLVEKARLNLHIAIVDSDAIHATHLNKTLTALGCAVATYQDVASAMAGIEGGGDAGLLVVDAELESADDLIRWGKEKNIPAFVSCENLDEAGEDRLMRAGAALILGKPIDVDALLTQASFMVG